MDDLIGREIGGFRIVAEIGHGGMGVVYLAEQRSPARKVALKVLRMELALDPDFRGRFARESDAAASTEHPNVVPVYAAGESDGLLFIAMRYVDGTDHGTLLGTQGALEAARAVDLVSQIAEGLDAAHDRGLVHRDVKPGNVLIARSPGGREHAMLSDFGLIKRRDVETNVTRTGQFMGSIAYCAPEQIRGDEVDGRADVYSLGCLLFECLTGQPPFRRESEVATLYAHLEDAPPKPSGSAEGVPASLDDVVARAMAKRPDDRYPTAGALGSAAREALPSGHAGPGPARPSVGSRRRVPVLVAAIVVMAAAIGVIAAALIGGSGDRRQDPASASGSPAVSGATGSAGAVTGLESGNGVLAFDPETGAVVSAVDVAINNSGEPSIATGEGGIWVHDLANVTHLDPKSGEIQATIPIGSGLGNPGNVAVGLRTVWAGNRTSVERVNPATDELLRHVDVASGAVSKLNVAVGEGQAWALDPGGVLWRITEGGDVDASDDVSTSGDGIAVGAGSVWVLDSLEGAVIQIDPGSLRPTDRFAVPGNVQRIAVLGSRVWVLDTNAGSVTSIDPTTGRLGAPIRVGERATDLATGLGSLWVTDQGGALWRIDPVTSTATELKVDGPLAAAAVDEGSGLVWIVVVDVR